jgi:CHAT domain-containing protein
MRFYLHSLSVGLLLCLPVAGQPVDIKFTPGATSISRTIEQDFVKGEISALDYWGSRMIYYFRKDNFDALRYAMEELLGTIKDENNLEERVFTYLTKYGYYCLTYNYAQEAKSIFSYVIAKTDEDSYAHWMAKWYLASTGGMLEQIEKVRSDIHRQVEKEIWPASRRAEISQIVGASIFTKPGSPSPTGGKSTTQQRKEEQLALMTYLTFRSREERPQPTPNDLQSLIDFKRDYDISKWLMPSLLRFIPDGNSGDSPGIRQPWHQDFRSLHRKLSAGEILRYVDQANSLLALEALDKYAPLLLSQPDFKPETASILELFDVKYAIYEKYLERSLTAPFFFNAVLDPFNEISAESLLVIAHHLYQRTGDRSYLTRSIHLLDVMGGVGVLAPLVAEHHRQGVHLPPAPAVSISSIAQLRQRVATTPSPEHKSRWLTKVLEETLPTPERGSATLQFHHNDFVLYRVFHAADTLRVDALNASLPQIQSLTASILSLIDGDKTDQLASQSRALFDLLFGNLRDEMPERLHLVAGGFLEPLPFAALRMELPGEPAKYFGVEHALSRQFSLTSMKLLTAKPSSAPRATPLALAPSFRKDHHTGCAIFRKATGALPPLHFNERELADLEALGNGRFLYGSDARRKAFLQYAPQHSILHLATHAVADQEDGLKSKLFLFGEDGQPAALRAGDIARLDLTADLVTLSACESSAGGQHIREGTVGLTRAFLAAGGKCVVSSRWSVDDYATAEFMHFFYRSLRGGNPAFVALRDARREYLLRYPEAHPLRWATFEAWGGLATPAWEDQRQHPYWLYLAGTLLLIGAFVSTKRAKNHVAA